MTDHPILFIPGPTEVDAELREIMSTPLIGHREARFKDCAIALGEQLCGLFGGAPHAFFGKAPATCW